MYGKEFIHGKEKRHCRDRTFAVRKDRTHGKDTFAVRKDRAHGKDTIAMRKDRVHGKDFFAVRFYLCRAPCRKNMVTECLGHCTVGKVVQPIRSHESASHGSLC